MKQKIMVLSITIVTGALTVLYFKTRDNVDRNPVGSTTAIVISDPLLEKKLESHEIKQAGPELLSLESDAKSKKSPGLISNVPSLESLAAAYADLSPEEIQIRVKTLNQAFTKDDWIARANKDLLTTAEREKLAEMLQEDSALQLAALHKRLEQMEKDYL